MLVKLTPDVMLLKVKLKVHNERQKSYNGLSFFSSATILSQSVLTQQQVSRLNVLLLLLLQL
jgi:hypothetical protein